MVYRMTPEPSAVITAPGDITRQMQEASILEAESKREGTVRHSTALDLYVWVPLAVILILNAADLDYAMLCYAMLC